MARVDKPKYFSIPPLPRHNLLDPTSRLLHIPNISRDHMTMAVHHCLPGCLANIEPDIVPGRRELHFDHILTRIDQSKNSLFLLNRHREKIRNMPERDHEQVPLADRVAVPAGIAEIILCNDVIRQGIAERAVHWRLHASNPLTSIRYSHFSPSRSSAMSCQPGTVSGEPVRARLISRENRLG